MAVAKRQRREKPVKTSGKTNSPPGQPSSHGAGSRGGEKHTKRGAKIELGVSLLFTARPHSSRMYFPLLANKLSYNTGPSITSIFCCGKTKLRKLSTPPTIPISKKGNAKECSNQHTIAIISHTSKVMLKIPQARLQQYVNRELSVVQNGFRKGRETRNQIANIHWIIGKAKEFQKKHLLLLHGLC